MKVSFIELVKLHENASGAAVGSGAIATIALPLGRKPRKKRKKKAKEDVVPLGQQWAPSQTQLDKIWQIVQSLINKGLGDELNELFDNFLYTVEQYNDMAPNSELEGLSERHLRQIYGYGKSINWARLTRAGFKARQRGIARSWGKPTGTTD